ncbi:MAG TPA: Zn-ribbon domain-containing OB-fold protein [Syntrophales bacterium]|nr:Zn-ribbon domain-containing OB-fold protein [Syntrophales bacterium]
MSKEYRTLKTEIRLPYELSYGPVWTRFFEGLAEKKIYGTRCTKCGRVLVPARSFCPRCFVDTDEWVEVAQTGVLTAWCYVNYRYFGMPTEPPFISALLRLDGTDVDFLHIIGGFDLSDFEKARKIVKNGMKLQAVWADELRGHIMDIRYFKPL